jgi:hypothetical protein
MPTINATRREKTDELEIVEIRKLRDQWSKAKRQLETEVFLASCSMPGCRTMPFVTLKTNTSRRPLCLRHFEMLSGQAV